jgi:hypothetical protein
LSRSSKPRPSTPSVLSRSRYIDAPSDLELLFADYDNVFFAGNVKQSLGDFQLRVRPLETHDKCGWHDGPILRPTNWQAAL